MSVKVTKKIEFHDEELQKLMKSVTLGNKYHVRVGVPSGKLHKKQKDQKKASTLVEIAFTHEFGSDRRHIPERSFLRLGLEKGRGRLIKVAGQELKNVLNKGKVEDSLERIGLQAQSEVKAVFKDNNWPPNSPTVYLRKLKKGKGTNVRPLIDTGQLVQSVTSEVHKN